MRAERIARRKQAVTGMKSRIKQLKEAGLAAFKAGFLAGVLYRQKGQTDGSPDKS